MIALLLFVFFLAAKGDIVGHQMTDLNMQIVYPTDQQGDKITLFDMVKDPEKNFQKRLTEINDLVEKYPHGLFIAIAIDNDWETAKKDYDAHKEYVSKFDYFLWLGEDWRDQAKPYEIDKENFYIPHPIVALHNQTVIFNMDHPGSLEDAIDKASKST